MKLNKLRTRFSYHKKNGEKKLQETLDLFLFQDWRVVKEEKNPSEKKHENSLSENKLKSCRKMLTSRSRYSVLRFPLVFVAVSRFFRSILAF